MRKKRKPPSLIDVPCFHKKNRAKLARMGFIQFQWDWFNKSMWFVNESHSHSYLNVKYWIFLVQPEMNRERLHQTKHKLSIKFTLSPIHPPTCIQRLFNLDIDDSPFEMHPLHHLTNKHSYAYTNREKETDKHCMCAFWFSAPTDQSALLLFPEESDHYSPFYSSHYAPALFIYYCLFSFHFSVCNNILNQHFKLIKLHIINIIVWNTTKK